MTLHVRFKPESVELKVDSENPKAGKTAVITCTSGSSNPTATIIWRKGAVDLKGQVNWQLIFHKLSSALTISVVICFPFKGPRK